MRDYMCVGVYGLNTKKGYPMSKILIRLHLPEPKVRKKTVKIEQQHKDKSKYSRKAKHKSPWESSGAFVMGFG